MAEINDVYGSIYQNLIDAGCDRQKAEQCMVFVKDGRLTDRLSGMAITGRYSEENPFPGGTGRGEAYNPYLKELTVLIDELKMIGTRFDASPAQVATAWAIAKGTLPIIGVTKSVSG